MGVITMVIIFVCLKFSFVIYIACYDFTHKKLPGTKKPLANLIARSKEQKWEECRQQNIVQRDKECIFFPRANCVVISASSFKFRKKINLPCTLTQILTPAALSKQFLNTSCKNWEETINKRFIEAYNMKVIIVG